MREIDKIAESLFEKVRDRFEDVSLGDENAKAVSDPEKARFFNFDYVVNGHNHGNITMSIIDENSLKIYYSKNISDDLNPEEKKHWYAFLKELREFARRNLMSFEPRDITRSTLKHRDVQQQSKADSTYTKDEVVAESKLYGTSRSSYENRGPVRIVVRHTDHINPESRGARSRHIKGVFLETHEGERRKLPINSLKYARAMARHCSEGGSMEDEFGQHITEIASELAKLRPFKNSMRHRTFEDSETQSMVEAANEYHGLLNHTLKRISGRKGYQACKEQFEARSTSWHPEEEFDESSIRERFVRKVYNTNVDEALPLVYKAYSMKKNNKFAESFENWANTVAESWDEDEEGVKQWGIEPINVDDLIDLFAEPIPLGVDAVNSINAVSDIINNNELEAQLAQAARENPEVDARDIIVAWLQENVPAVYQELMNEIGDQDTADQYDEDIASDYADETAEPGEFSSTHGSADDGMDGQVNEEYCDACDSTECHCDEVHEDEYEDNTRSEEAIQSAIIRRITNQHLDLLKKYGPQAIMDASADVAWDAAPVEEIGSSDVSAWVQQVIYQLEGTSDLAEAFNRALGEGRMKDVDMDLKELSDEEFKAKYNKTKEEMKAALAEGQGQDYADKSWLKKQGKKSSNEPSLKDKLLSIPKGAKAWVKGQPDDDKSLGISEMRRLAGLK